MIDEKSLAKEVIELETLRSLAKVYGEVASIRIKKTRDSVLDSRAFQEEIASVFAEVRNSYAREVQKLARKHSRENKERITFLPHNGKTVAVLFSANTRLYGDLVQRTFHLFMKDIKEKQSEAAIIGKVGLAAYLEEEPDRPYSYFDYPDNAMDHEKLVEIIRHLVQYEEIHVFYGKFINIVNQEPTKEVVNAELPTVEGEDVEVKVHYLFEPTLEDILKFFEKQMFAALLEQTIKESQLAKFASRLVAMDRAEQNIQKELEVMKVQKLQIIHRAANRKQQNSMNSIFGRV